MEAAESRNYCVHLNFLVARCMFSSILSWPPADVTCDFRAQEQSLPPLFALPSFLRPLPSVPLTPVLNAREKLVL